MKKREPYTHTHTHLEGLRYLCHLPHSGYLWGRTKPTRSPAQFPRMLPKWSCKQALSLTGRKIEEREGGRERKRGRERKVERRKRERKREREREEEERKRERGGGERGREREVGVRQQIG